MTPMQQDAWFRFFPGDFIKDTNRLFNDTLGAYLRLLLNYYTDGPLPKDTQVLAFIAHVKPEEWGRTWGMLERYFVLIDGYYHQKRCDEEIKWREESIRKKLAQTEAARLAKMVKPRTEAAQEQPATHVTTHVTEPVTTHCNNPSPQFLLQGTESESESEPKTKAESEPIKKNTGARFRKPTVEEMVAQGQKIGLPPSECEACFHHFESNGWKVGRNPMKSWPSAMITWRTNWESRGRPGLDSKSSTQTPFALNVQYRALTDELIKIEGNCARDPHGRFVMDDKTRAHYRELKQKAVEVRSKLQRLS